MYEFWGVIPSNQRTYVDFHLGMLLAFKGLEYGASFRHLTQPDHGFTAVSKLPFKITAHISYTFDMSDNVKLEPAFAYQSQNAEQQHYEQVIPSATCSIHGARIGIANRFAKGWPNAFIVMAGYERDWFRVGYSYDIGTDSKARGGSHEVNLTFKFNKRNKEDWRKGPKMISF